MPVNDAIREGHTLCQEILETVEYVQHESSSVIGVRRMNSGFTLDQTVQG